MWRVSYQKMGGGAQTGASTVTRVRLAVLLELADAHGALLDELVLVELADVRLRDPGDGKRHRRHVLRAVISGRGLSYRLAPEQRDRSRGRGCRLQRPGLVDRSGLPAGEES